MHISFICQILLRNHEQCKAGVSPIQNLFHCFPSGAMIQPFGMAQDIQTAIIHKARQASFARNWCRLMAFENFQGIRFLRQMWGWVGPKLLEVTTCRSWYKTGAVTFAFLKMGLIGINKHIFLRLYFVKEGPSRYRYRHRYRYQILI